ncbi:MAG TPA: aspartyl protease family protein, partial [Ferruginibacter sp.]|nr:aspartyl protease family protein [Ferruginibacter sp.]
CTTGTNMMKWVFAWICACLLTVNPAGAQEIMEQPEAGFLARVPFRQFSGGIMIIRATVDHVKDSLNFILDTGSGGISLDSATCTDLGISIRPSDTSITGIAGVKKVPFAFNKTLHLPGLDVDKLNFHVNDYDILSSVYGEKIDGIIGYSFFSRYVVKINFDSLYLEVFTPGKIEYPYGSTTLRPIFTTIPIQNMQVKDKRKVQSNFYFDTGAGLCFLMSERFIHDSSILHRKRKPLLTQAEGMGGKMQMRLTVVKEVKLGPYHFRAVPTYLYKDVYNVTAYPYTGGLVGNDILRRFNMIVNYPQREINIIPNSHFHDSFEYGYTGLSIYQSGDKITVGDVIPGSPADEAGFKTDDELISVGTNFSGIIQQYKNILQEPKKRITVIVRRNDQLQQLVIETMSIR